MTFRPAADDMAIVTALLRATDAASVRSALTEAADRCADGRNRGQAMADTLVARVTGRDVTVPVPVAVKLVLSDNTLFGGSAHPARLEGYGPIPATMARRLISDAVADDDSWATLRRLYAAPTPVPWSPWNPDHDAFPEASPISSPCVTKSAAPVLQCPDTTHRPRNPASPPWADQRRQRRRTV